MLRIMNIPRERSFVDLVFIAFISCGIPAEVVNTGLEDVRAYFD